MDEDKECLLEQIHGSKLLRQNRRGRWLTAGRVFFFFNILFLAAGLGVWVHINMLLKKFTCDTKTAKFEPDLAYDTPVTFETYAVYGAQSTNVTDSMWKRLSPPGDGIVQIPNEYTAGLRPSRPAPHNPETHTVYGISMFHQLHCLNFLHSAFTPEAVAHLTPDQIVLHRDHCLDFIRQGIMCAGDSTFEPVTKTGINGMGVTHKCRSFDKMYSWAYKHRSDKPTS
ncbi:hypothetical protein CMQ_6996 [Grosmannia clavigera kw1407]|uniref:Oxidase ustYa n=1 Tax=Grosmannia clavigera (strain kw1407 / UAMH 11150) TaxID=655863 RepID=F0X6V4_GROCL|nr:uncharacterized protein CMQ_6996 [Grosmannia clavigera kw1407]EFX06675.1 hypothetical protein CMQ_6996 [Grosmannia clavigera kw1407]